MKRALSLILVLAIFFPALLLPAFAAEPDEYVFELIEPVSTYSRDYNTDKVGIVFVYYDVIPDGYYQMILTDSTGSQIVSGVFYFSFIDPSLTDTLRIYSPIIFDNLTYYHNGNSRKLNNVYFSYYSWHSRLNVDVLSNSKTYSHVFTEMRFRSVSINDLSESFLSIISSGLVDLSGNNLFSVILVSLGIVTTPVILWFGYRFVKRNVVKSFTKGKM